MVAESLRSYPGPISLAALVAGVVLIVTGSPALGVVGIALLVAAFLVPFLRLSVLPSPANDPEPDPERQDVRTNSEARHRSPVRGRGFVASSAHAHTTPRKNGSSGSQKQRGGFAITSKDGSKASPKPHQHRVKGVPQEPTERREPLEK